MHADEPQFIEELRSALESPSPAALIEGASMLAALQDGSGDDELYSPHETAPGVPYPHAFAVLDLAPVFVESDTPETNAVLRVWAEMLGDDMLRRRVINSVSTREHPDWLDALDRVTVTHAVSMGDHFGEEETVLLEAHIDGHAITMACALQHMGTTSLDDAYLLPVSITTAFGDLPPDVSTRTVMRDLDLTTARNLIAGAVEFEERLFPPIETDSWPATKPALEWLLRLMPDDPADPEQIDQTGDDARAALREQLELDFAASPEGQALPQRVRDEAGLVFEFQLNYGTGDGKRWGPAFVEHLMLDLYPRKYLAPDRTLLQLPRLLTAIVTWANARSGVPAESTAAVVKLIQELAPEYRDLIKNGGANPFPFGVGAFSDPNFLATMGLGRDSEHEGHPFDASNGGAVYGEHRGHRGRGEHREHDLPAFLQEVPPPLRDVFLRADSPDVQWGEDPLQDLILDAFPDSQPQYSAGLMRQFTLQLLEREVGGAPALAALDAQPLPQETAEEAFARYAIAADVLPRLRRIGAILVPRATTVFEDPELVTAALRVLARTAAADPALFRRAHKEANAAAAACWIAAWMNEWFDPYAGSGRTQKAVREAFGMKNSPRDRGETFVRAMGAQIYSRSGDFFLGDPGLLVSWQRATLIESRDHIGHEPRY